MPVKDPNYNPWWARVVFDEYCAHYISMTPEEKAKDVEQSINDVLKKNDKGNSFGAKMVAWALGRMEANRTARAPGGAKGGRPRKNPEQPTRDGAAGSATTQQTDPKLSNPAAPSHKIRTMPMPLDKQAVLDFAEDNGLDVDDAYECWHVTVNERHGLTADGKRINNWKAYVTQWCHTRQSKREK